MLELELFFLGYSKFYILYAFEKLLWIGSSLDYVHTELLLCVRLLFYDWNKGQLKLLENLRRYCQAEFQSKVAAFLNRHSSK